MLKWDLDLERKRERERVVGGEMKCLSRVYSRHTGVSFRTRNTTKKSEMKSGSIDKGESWIRCSGWT